MKIPLLRAKVHENRPINTIATREIPKIRNFIGEHCRSTAFTMTHCTGSAACTRTCNIHTQISHFAVLIALLPEKVAWEWLPLKKCFGHLFLLLRPSRGPISKLKRTSKIRAPSECPLKTACLSRTSPEMISGLYTHRHTDRQTDRQTDTQLKLCGPGRLHLPQESMKYWR